MQTWLRLIFIATMGASFALGLAETAATPALFPHQDKLGHFLVYLSLGLLGFIAWPNHRVILYILLLTHGFAMEFAQSLTDHRQADIWDWLADAAGASLAWLGFVLVAHRRNSNQASS